MGVAFASIDWDAAPCPVSQYFTVREAIYLPTWKRLATPADFAPPLDFNAVCQNLWTFFNTKMDAVRDFAGCPLIVHVTLRPPAYNLQIGGAKNSAHIEGIASDFNPAVGSCQNLIDRLKPTELDALALRCEDNGYNPSWVHLDSRAPGPGGRFFKP